MKEEETTDKYILNDLGKQHGKRRGDETKQHFFSPDLADVLLKERKKNLTHNTHACTKSCHSVASETIKHQKLSVHLMKTDKNRG